MQRTANPRMWVRFPPGPYPTSLPGRRRPSRPRSRLWRLAALSAALHLGVVMLLALRLSGGARQEASPPPADFAMVFQSAAPRAATAPRPSGSAPPAKQARTPSPPSPPPAATPAAVPRAAVQPPAKPPPIPKAAPRPPPERIPAPSPVVPPAPQPQPAQVAPRPALPPLHAPRPATQPPPQPRARPPTAVAGAGKFPAPIMRSFFIPSTASGNAHPFSRAFASGDQAVLRGKSNDRSFDLQGADQLGSAWINAFMAWVDEHKHYPEQAAANGEDGNTTVQFTVDRYGHVKEVRLYERSGSVWLDMGLTGMFRDAHLPPFPYGTAENDVQMLFTMHYIIDR